MTHPSRAQTASSAVPTLDTETLFMSPYPRTIKDAVALTQYWLEDQEIRVETLLGHLSSGLRFERASAGWSVHTSSEMAVPPHIEQPPLRVRPSSLWQVGLLACIASRWPLATVLALPCSSPMHAAINYVVSDQVSTPPAVAMCLQTLLHPALTQEVQLTCQRYVMRCGSAGFSALLEEAMASPLDVVSHQEHLEVLSAVQRGCITLTRHQSVGMVVLPCSVKLVCSSTDHVLLFMLLLSDRATVLTHLLEKLDASTSSARSLFWRAADDVHIRANKTGV